MAKLHHLARMTTPTTGDGPVTLGAAVTGHLSFAHAGLKNGDVISYAIVEGESMETGRGVYSIDGPTLTRQVLHSSNGNLPLNLTGSAEVFISDVAGGVSEGAAAIGNGSLNSLYDVSIEIPEAGNLLRFDGVKWANADAPKANLVTDATQAIGDMLYRHSLGEYVNVALASLGAVATASSYFSAPYAPSKAIDLDNGTKWHAAQSPVAGNWIAIDLGQERTINSWFLWSRDGVQYTATAYKVQTSPNGVNWTDVQHHVSALEEETVNFITPQTARHFRFYATAGGVNHWSIYTLRLFEPVAVPSLQRLPIGADGQYLSAASGIPVWKTLTLPTKTPASATAAGVAGEVCYDADYLYVCVAANTWRRVAIATW